MSYSTDAQVKEVLGITEATWDIEIGNCRTTADGFIDSILKARGFTVPLSSVPQNIEDASIYFAAFYFMERRAPHEENVSFYDRAMDFLNKYISQSPEDEIAFIVGTDTS